MREIGFLTKVVVEGKQGFYLENEKQEVIANTFKVKEPQILDLDLYWCTNLFERHSIKELSIEDIAEIMQGLFKHTPSGELMKWEKRHYLAFIKQASNASTIKVSYKVIKNYNEAPTISLNFNVKIS